MSRNADHSAIQRAYFEQPDPDRFAWATRAEGFAETEDELLAPLLSRVVSPCLEVGCGEGNNLVRLLRRARCVGVDLFPRKLRFAAQQLPEARFVTADAGALPFGEGSFRTVFVRDLLHHVLRPEPVLREIVRVLDRGGLLCLIEPNGRNPIVNLQTRLLAAEAGARRFSPDHVTRLLAGLPLRDVAVITHQPFPLRRVVLHYRFGLPALGRRPSSRRLLTAAERRLGGFVPTSRWSYILATAIRDGD